MLKSLTKRLSSQPAAAGAGGAAAAPDPSDAWSARRYMIIGGAITLFLFFGVGVWSASATISGAVIAPAELRVENKRRTVQHLEGGVIEEIMVRDGDVVNAGDVLMRLDKTTIAANLEIVEAQLDELMARRARLQAEQQNLERIDPDSETLDRAVLRPQAAKMLEGQNQLFVARKETLKRQLNQLAARIEQTKVEIEGTQAQITALDRQLQLIRSELRDMRELLRKKLIQRSVVAARERDEARLDGERGALLSSVAQLEGRISEIEIRILELGSTRREESLTELREVQSNIAELRERRGSLAQTLSRMEIRAPQAGVVLDMAVNTVGGVVSPAEPLLFIVPTEEKLIVEAKIETFSRDQVSPNQKATVIFPGFNQRTTPEVFGLVKNIGADRQLDERSGFTYYVVEIDIPEDELERLRGAIDSELAPGMPAEAHIQTGDRTAASYFLKPIWDNFRRAFREE